MKIGYWLFGARGNPRLLLAVDTGLASVWVDLKRSTSNARRSFTRDLSVRLLGREPEARVSLHLRGADPIQDAGDGGVGGVEQMIMARARQDVAGAKARAIGLKPRPDEPPRDNRIERAAYQEDREFCASGDGAQIRALDELIIF